MSHSDVSPTGDAHEGLEQPPLEIERKFIADPAAAQLPAQKIWRIEQGYFDDALEVIPGAPGSASPEGQNARLRLRIPAGDGWPTESEMSVALSDEFAQKVQRFAGPGSGAGYRLRLRVDAATGQEEGFLTIKGHSSGAARMELEESINPEFVKYALAHATKKKLKKTRYLIEHKGQGWELDVFMGALLGLVLAELELKTEDQAIDIPSWAGKEVTEDPRYSNASLAKRASKELGVGDLMAGAPSSAGSGKSAPKRGL